MNDILKTIAEFGISAVTITGLIAFTGKRIFEHYLKLKVDSFKNELEMKAIEFQNELERINFEHQIKFSKLHNERAEIIKILFNDFTQLEKLINHVTTTLQGPEWHQSNEREVMAEEFLERTKSTFENNKIYFPISLCDQIQDALNICKSFINESLSVKVQSNQQIEDRNYLLEMKTKGETAFTKWLKLEKESQDRLSKIRSSLATRFRELIGVDNI